MWEFSMAATTAVFSGYNGTWKKVLALCLLWLVAVQVAEVSAVDADCNLRQYLQPEITYFVYNPGYPLEYSGPRSCRWEASSAYRVRLTCSNVNLPLSNGCMGDNIAVNVGNNIIRRRCGNAWFIEESIGNKMIVTFDAQLGNRGSFVCSLQAISPADANCRCGWKKQTRIVGGTETGINEYPMMAGIINIINRELYCGGTIISPIHILTAAHCLMGRDRSILAVVVGEHNVATGSDTNATVLYSVRNYRIHPMYHAMIRNYDIAIVEINGLIMYTNEVGPVCLPFKHSGDSFNGQPITLLGWGLTDAGGPKSDYLQQVNVRAISNSQCMRYYSTVTNNQMCTFAPGKDACQFDSGGPALWMDPSTRRLLLAGIITYGTSCGTDDPGVNERVGVYMQWILEQTASTKYCIKV